MKDLGFAVAETDRRTGNLVQVGVVTAVAAGKARVRIGELDTPEIPVAQLRAGALSFWWMPTVGEQVVVACPSGDVARGIVLASIFAGNAPSSNLGEPMIDLAGGRIVINGSIEVTGSIEVAGDVASEGSMTVAGDVTASGISLATHVHGGVTPGGGSTGEARLLSGSRKAGGAWLEQATPWVLVVAAGVPKTLQGGDVVVLRSDWRPGAHTTWFTPIVSFPGLAGEAVDVLQWSTDGTTWHPVTAKTGEAGSFEIRMTNAGDNDPGADPGAPDVLLRGVAVDDESLEPDVGLDKAEGLSCAHSPNCHVAAGNPRPDSSVPADPPGWTAARTGLASAA